MRVGISCYDVGVAELVEVGRAADELGFSSLWLGEHVLAPMAYESFHPTQPGEAGATTEPEQGSSDHNGKPIVDLSVHLTDPLIALTAVAAATRTLQLATGIYLLPLRHPLLAARAAATLAEVSGERFALGIGSGWLREEFAALGVPFAGRTARLEEQIAVFRAALAGGPFEFRGEHYDIDRVQLCGAPVNVPVVMGGNTEPALRRAVQLGDGWFTSGIPSLEQALRLRDRIAELSDEYDRTTPLTTTWRVAAPDPELLDRYAAEGFEDVLVMKYDVWVGDDPLSRRAALADVAHRLGLQPQDARNGSTGMNETPTVEEFRAQARAWLSEHAPARRAAGTRWGEGSDGVAVFHDLSVDEERALIARLTAWEAAKYDAGYGALTWPVEDGGRGLDPVYEDVFAEEAARFATPEPHELVSVTRHLIAPTVRLLGSASQRELVTSLLRADALCCQLFSEPSAGSDLATLGTRAERVGDEWVLNGQKVWSSGAHFAGWGELIARSDPSLPKHAGLTAFLLPMDTPGVEIRPLRQMSGGSSFCEVFLTDVRIPDSLRLGDVGAGWKVALTTLGFERGNSSASDSIGGNFDQLLALTEHLGTVGDPTTRTQLAQVYAHEFLAVVAKQRDQVARRGGVPLGAIGSVRKLQWTEKMTLISDVVTDQLGPLLTTDTGEWGTFAWAEHVLGAPGYRIAGGSDEVQRNIVAERLLGMPAEPRVDRHTPWSDLPR